MLQVWCNGSDWIIAESAEDAAKVWEETMGGESWQPYADDGDIFELDNRVSWKITFEEEYDAKGSVPDEAKIIHDEPEDYYRVEATQQQWIDKVGRSWFCSENWQNYR